MKHKEDIKTIIFEDDVRLKDVKAWFRGCKSLITVVNLPNSLEKAEYMFADCDQLCDVTLKLPDSLMDGKAMVFICKMLNDISELPDTLTVGLSMFAECGKLSKSPNFPKHLK